MPWKELANWQISMNTFIEHTHTHTRKHTHILTDTNTHTHLSLQPGD